jgi:putative ABC transport system permease protein
VASAAVQRRDEFRPKKSDWERMMLWYQQLFRRARTEKRLDAEFRFHLEQQIADYVAAGMTLEEARRRARLEFGGLDQVKEECRDVGAARFLETVIQDLRYGLRQLRRNPGFTAVAAITFALGIGANTAIFSLANAAFFRRLPYPHADRLAFLWQQNKRTGESEGAVSYPNYVDWRAQSHDFKDMAFITFGTEFLTGSGTKTILTGPNGPERVSAALVSTNFFSVLGVSPMLGRSFTPDESAPGLTDVAVISYGLWRSRFGGDPQIIGRRENFGGAEDTIIGVMPRGFAFPTGAQIWRPREIVAFMRMRTRQYPNMVVVGRLKRGVGWSQARAEMNTIAGRLAVKYPSVDRGVGIRIVPLREQLSESVRRGIVVLWGFVAAVLLIACFNTAGLLVGRTAARQKEIVVRFSLGATRRRLARQFIGESLLIAFAGALVGILLAISGLNALSKLNANVARLHGSVLDFRVLAYTAAVTIIAGLVCGVLPLFTVSRIELGQALKQSSATAAPAAQRTRRALIVAEVAVTVVLLVASGLLIRSLRRILQVNPGFDAEHILALDVRWVTQPKNAAEDTARAAELSHLLAQLRRVPGVKSVAPSSFLLFPTEMYKVPFEIKGRLTSAQSAKPLLLHGDASPDFFRTLGIPLLRGREFSERDTADGATPVAVINRAMVRRYWPAGDALGQQFRFADPNFKSPWFTVVGIVGDVREQGLERNPVPMAYVASAVNPYDEIMVHVAGDPLARAGLVRNEIHDFDKYLMIWNISSADSILDRPESQRRFNAWVLEGFALIALILGAVGIYGVLVYWVSQRVQEIGVRMALGAQRGDVLALVITQGLSIALTGLGIGIVAALVVSRFLSSLLYGIKPNDPLTFITVSLILLGVVLLACYIPARRAAKVDPVVALRQE